MSQNPTGPVPGQQGAPQGVPPQGVPPQGYPQQGAPQGYPQQGAPQGYPQQGAPQGYPQQGAPQGYPPQPPYPPAGYPQAPQPGMPQQGYPGQYGRPAYGPQAGYGQPPGPGGRPTGRASSSKVLMIVIGAVVLLVIAGGVLLMLSNRSPQPAPVTPVPPPTVPTATTPPTTQPTDEPTAEPTDNPTPEPTDTPTEPAGQVVDLGSGVMFAPADGWEIQEQAPGAISVSDGKAVFVTRVSPQKKNTNAAQLCDSFNRKVLEQTPGAKFGDASDLNVKLKNLTVAQCPAAFISTSNGKSTQMLVVTFAAVRTTDGIATLSTLLFTKDTPDTSFSDVDKMLGVVLVSQSAG